MIKIPPISGNIQFIPLSSYEEIIKNYVDKVGNLEQVSSVIQMGSFTTPGISDIDLIVVIKDGMAFPDWKDISLKNISKDHKDAEVIAHDIFVIPEFVAQNVEAYFYIDQQNVLKGKQLGGNISQGIVDKCKEFLALEYAIFSLDSIASTLLNPAADLRSTILLISSMRHSSKIAFDLKIINNDYKNEIKNRIEKLRSDVISNEYSVEDFSYLFENFINLLSSSIEKLLKNATDHIASGKLKNSWIVNPKTAMVGVKKEEDFLEKFLRILEKQKGTMFSKNTKIFCVPIEFQMHIGAYLDGDKKAAIYFKNSFKNIQSFHDENELNTRVRQLRGEVAYQHWDFITRSGYKRSSGKAYFGIPYPGPKDYKSVLKKGMLYYQMNKLVVES
ncbi:MAG: hypothetical protein ABI261_04810 [Ginsengibacter sp.]